MLDMNVNIDHSSEEHAAASAVASLSGWKRERDAADVAGGLNVHKMARVEDATGKHSNTSSLLLGRVNPSELTTSQPCPQGREPFFQYTDYSREIDPDPLTPLTAPGRVPNFPAKMYAILSRPDLSDVVSWMPHGRSWRVLKPREFEMQVIPRYFEHSKFSSFIRQANGWGFRRITQGRDRNSYYHPLFLRGLPHLCKKMKRPGVSEKASVDPDHEPNFYQMSEVHPLPEKATDDSIMLQCTVQGGPKARMPVYTGSLTTTENVPDPITPGVAANTPLSIGNEAQMTFPSFRQRLGASDNDVRLDSAQGRTIPNCQQPLASSMFLPNVSFLRSPVTTLRPTSSLPNDAHGAGLTTSDYLAFALQSATPIPTCSAAQAAASQFAAGFAAATALSSTPAVQQLLAMQVSPGPIRRSRPIGNCNGASKGIMHACK